MDERIEGYGIFEDGKLKRFFDDSEFLKIELREIEKEIYVDGWYGGKISVEKIAISKIEKLECDYIDEVLSEFKNVKGEM